MGRKEPQNSQQPVEQYRKQIGKQDTKKSKVDLKETKKKAQARKTFLSTYKEILLMIGALGLVVFSLYILLYFILIKE